MKYTVFSWILKNLIMKLILVIFLTVTFFSQSNAQLVAGAFQQGLLISNLRQVLQK